MSETTTPVRSNGRILTTHAGSLPRPKDLVELYAKRVDGKRINLRGDLYRSFAAV